MQSLPLGLCTAFPEVAGMANLLPVGVQMPKDQEISNGNGFGVDAEITSIMGTSKFDFCPFPFVIFFSVEKNYNKMHYNQSKREHKFEEVSALSFHSSEIKC